MFSAAVNEWEEMKDNPVQNLDYRRLCGTDYPELNELAVVIFTDLLIWS